MNLVQLIMDGVWKLSQIGLEAIMDAGKSGEELIAKTEAALGSLAESLSKLKSVAVEEDKKTEAVIEEAKERIASE